MVDVARQRVCAVCTGCVGCASYRGWGWWVRAPGSADATGTMAANCHHHHAQHLETHEAYVDYSTTLYGMREGNGSPRRLSPRQRVEASKDQRGVPVRGGPDTARRVGWIQEGTPMQILDAATLDGQWMRVRLAGHEDEILVAREHVHLNAAALAMPTAEEADARPSTQSLEAQAVTPAEAMPPTLATAATHAHGALYLQVTSSYGASSVDAPSTAPSMDRLSPLAREKLESLCEDSDLATFVMNVRGLGLIEEWKLSDALNSMCVAVLRASR